MKTLTIHQPHASLIALGSKHYETRSWATKYRGAIAIHAGKTKYDVDSLKSIMEKIERAWDMGATAYIADDGFTATVAMVLSQRYPTFALPYGAIVAVGQLVDCIPMTKAFVAGLSEQERAFGNYALANFAWQIDNIRLLTDPIPAKGKLGLWEWPSDEI